ncbi:TetR/AcrR family transcriptional regulator [Aestuariicella hydrocarbonica]|uniref:TetR/AcrR family transcriptional regulator n=1 Tax=Pseudomaricurvus hydrocarbonicus TaxID=1470433 RepID=A0A9E5MM95_9GAMM|nr:TetR/AcrR family transcriptional regulator [Aestuariicella hydrocarbonica]NHO66668.1 TetR/AcrR family transcriptional regulator [Aestuariicella hydrocarbonica]
MPDTKPQVTDDARQRSAQRRREKMRQRLLFAALDVFLMSEITRPPVIDDVIRKAGVSRGTFYKYFTSLEEVLRELGQTMAEDMIKTYERVFIKLTDPAARLAAGPLLSLTHAAMQPRRVEFTIRVDYIDYLSRGTRAREIITDSLDDARQAGLVHFTSLTAITDMVIGSTLEGGRRLMHTKNFDESYIDELVRLILLGCGLTAESSHSAITLARQELEVNTHQLHWWQPN